MQTAVATLGERDRELVALRYGADLTAAQIGELLELSPNAVEVALHRALRRLRAELEADAAPKPRVQLLVDAVDGRRRVRVYGFSAVFINVRHNTRRGRQRRMDFSNHDELGQIEAALRSERPRLGGDVESAICGRIGGGRSGGGRRAGMAVVLSVGTLVAMSAFGGVGYATSGCTSTRSDAVAFAVQGSVRLWQQGVEGPTTTSNTAATAYGNH